MAAFASWRSVIARLVGVLLLAAATLKVYGLGTDPVARMGIFSAPEFQLAVILFEVTLGAWLLSGKRPAGAWLMAVLTFSGFAAVSFYQGLVGQTSCGCFGRLSVSPWYAFGLDIAVVTALVFGRPDFKALREKPREQFANVLISGAGTVVGVVMIAVLLIGLAHVRFGSVAATIAYFRGDRISVEPRLLDVGGGAAGEEREVSVTLTN